MPKSKKLQKQIETKLEQLKKIIEKIGNSVIEPDDPEVWDPDYYYNLEAKLKEALQLLQEQKSQQLDDWGRPIILEEGICSLVDSYQSEDEEE